MKKSFAFVVTVAVAASATISVRGDTYTVAEGETQTLDSVTNTTRFTKSVYHQNGTQIIIR